MIEDVGKFKADLCKILFERQIKTGRLEVENSEHFKEEPYTRVMFEPAPERYFACFKDVDQTQILKTVANLIEKKLHPERDYKRLLDAAMEIINGSSEESDKVQVQGDG